MADLLCPEDTGVVGRLYTDEQFLTYTLYTSMWKEKTWKANKQKNLCKFPANW